ncbi:MAG TPA: gamma-glutamyltransferase [Stellaceae bacterium]|nr:gamma-glutamyltransferase [Stellaceae bacterium]
MTESGKGIPEDRRTIGPSWARRQCAILLAASLVASCANSGSPVKLAGSTPVASGFVAADEPRAVRVARDILTAGGDATDAAVALGLALAVTLPSRAGLGGGGACVARPAYVENKSLFGIRRQAPAPVTEALEFLPRPPREGAAIGMPALARGLFALHAKYGKLRWEQLVSPAENLARFGMPVSHALIRDIAAAHADITGPSGKPLAEGETLPQGQLADILSALRQHGANGIYTGAVADAIAAGSNGAIDAAALRDYAPAWTKPQGLAFGDDRLYFTPGPGGNLARQLWEKVNGTAGTSLYTEVLRTIAGSGRADAAEIGRRELAVADAAAAMLPAAPAVDPEEGDAATGFVVVDSGGAAVACALTMGRKFGAGQALGGTGILASAAVPSARSDGLSGAAMLWANDNTGKLLAAFAAGGDRSGAQALVEAASNALKTRQSLDGALSAPRLFAAAPGALYAESGVSLPGRQASAAKGLGAVNAVLCPSGLPASKPDCAVEADPRGAGLTATIVR